MMKSTSKRLTDLEGKIKDAKPIGRPLLIHMHGYDAGIHYIWCFGNGSAIEGVHDSDTNKLYAAFRRQIRTRSPKKADAYIASDIVNLQGDYAMHVGMAVQYYKK